PRAPVLRGAFSLENPADRDTLPRGRQLQTALNELVVAHPVRAGCFWKAGVVRGIGKYSWKRIDLDHIRLSVGIKPDVDPRPVAAAKYAIRTERDALDFLLKRFVDVSGAIEHLKRALGAVPDPLGFVARDGKRSGGKRREVHSDDGENFRFVSVSEDRACELGTGQILLDDHRLLVGLEEVRRLCLKFIMCTAEILFGDSLRRSLVDRLGEYREGQFTGCRKILDVADDAEARSAHAVVGESFLCLCLVEAERKGERITAGIGNPVELADCRDMRLAVHAVSFFGDVEHDVGLFPAEILGEILVGLEANHFTKGRESARERVDGLTGVPLGKLVGEELGRVGFQIVGETDSSHRLTRRMNARDSCPHYKNRNYQMQ